MDWLMRGSHGEKMAFHSRSLSEVRVLVARRDFDRADAALLSLQEH